MLPSWSAWERFSEARPLAQSGGATEAQLKDRTLTNLCNQRPTWLAHAHERLDHAVLDAYGWPHDLSDEEILSRLLALNLERATRQGTAHAIGDRH